MADKIFHSSPVTFIDRTDDRKMDVYISSNHPTVQLHNANIEDESLAYTPNWGVDELELKASFYVDSTPITPTKIEWTSIIDTTTTALGSNSDLYVSANVLKDNPIITYRCSIEYQNLKAFKDITFTRVDTGVNGTNGSPAPAVQAQYSADGQTAWTSTLDPTVHKYIRHSYDGGSHWTTAIKMTGEDGTSVVIKGTAYTPDELVVGQTVRLYSDTNKQNEISKTGLSTGDSYLVSGYLCVYNEDNNLFICAGTIQGPQGTPGVSSYVYIRYAKDANGSTGIFEKPDSETTYIGVHISSTAINAPKDASAYTWAKFVGESAKSIVLSGNSQVFKVANKSDTSTTPDKIIITTASINISDTNNIVWHYRVNNNTSWTSIADGAMKIQGGIDLKNNTVTITGANLTSTITSITFKASYGVIEDIFTVYKVFDGTDGEPGKPGDSASMAFLTNENVTFAADANGNIPTTSIETRVVAYNGTTKIIPEIRKNTDGSYAISGLPTGMSFVVGTVTNNEIPIIFTITNSATVGYTATRNGSINIPVSLQDSTTDLTLSWSKVNSGTKGDKGNDGSDAYTILLTNESHVFAGDVNNAVVGTTETQALAYIGAKQQKIKILEVNGQTAAIIDTAVEGVTGLTFKCDTISEADSPKITFKCTTAFKSANGVIPIKLSVGGVEFTKMFTYSIAFKGSIGVQGPQGVAGKSMVGVIEHYLASASATGVTTATSGWTETMQTVTSAKKYLWNYEVITYSDGTITTINPVIIGAYGDTGSTGKGVSSIVEEYYQSTSATAQSDGTWSQTPPEWANGKYIWTRSIIKYTDNTTSTTSPVCITGQQGAIGGTGIGVDSVDVWYYQSTSATSLSGGSWSTKSPTWADGKYIWTKTITTYTNSTTDETTAVCITGQKGATGVGIKSVTEYYLATSLSSGVTTSASGWDTKVQTTTSTNKYLWNYEVITYTDNSTSTLTPIIIGVYGDTGSTGKGISGVKEYYLATTLASGVTTSTSGWTPEMQAVTSTKKYLWNYEVITYTDNTTSTVAPILIGAYGDKGDTGAPATSYWLVSSASAVQKTSTGTITVTPSTLTFTGKSKTGTNAPVDYACRWIIAYSTDGTNYTNLYTSTANEASKSITVLTTYKTIRVRMYMAGGTTALLDEQIIPVVSDGAKGDKGSQGDRGAGISSVTVTYGTSTSASTQPTSWQTTLPTVAEGSYLWTRTITDYTDDSITDTVTYTYAKQGKTPVKGTDYVDGTSVTVSSIQYQSSTSATTAPTGTWSNSVVVVAEGSYLWTKTTFSDGKVAYGVAKQGAKGSAGTPAPIVFLTNENISFSADVQGQIASSTVVSNIVAYNGTTKVLPTIGTITGAPSGMTITTSNSNNEIVMTIAISDKSTFGSPSSNSGTVSIPVTSPVNTTLRLTWSKINTGLNGANGNDAVVFQVYSENGYVLHKDVPNITLRTFAYIGDVPIEAGATYQWHKYNEGNWVAISNAVDSSLEVAHTDISYSGSYMCKMLFNGVEYVSVVTIDDKNDTNIVFTSKPSSYMTGDIWIVGSDYQPYQYVIATTFDSGITYYSNTSGKVANPQPTNKDAIKNGLYYIYTKAEIGTILRSEHTGNVYSDDDWISATRYDKQLQEIQSDISDYNQYFSFNKEKGLVIGAKDENGVHSKFSTSLSNTQLSFNYEGESVAYINGSKMNIKEAEIESPLTVTGKYSNGVIQQPPIINIGNFSIVVESNGSLSIISNT